jgi:hypothetical protein
MAREPLPPPLPPETRTVGQLVAETIRLYGRRFWPSLALGVPAAALDLLVGSLSSRQALAVTPPVGAVLLTASYIGATLLASEARPERRALLVAFAAGALAFVPFPFFTAVFILPGIAWLALVGLVVPVAIVERTGFRASFARAIRLARADYVHALGGLATLAVTVFLTRAVLFFLLRDFGESTARVAAFLADVVISPILFLGAALLYFDQAARVVESPPRRRSRDADLHPAHEPDRPGRPDPEVEPRPPARGEPRRRGARG